MPRKKPTRTRALFTAAILLLAPLGFAGAFAQDMPTPSESPAKHDPIKSRLIPPDVIMRNSQKISLTGEQREAIISAVQQIQSNMVRTKFEMEAARGQLIALLDQHPADEKKVEAILQRVLTIETKMKTGHLTMLLRIRNRLTADQLSQLKALRGPR